MVGECKADLEVGPRLHGHHGAARLRRFHHLCLVNVNIVVNVLTRDKVLMWGKGALCAVEDIGIGGLIFENKTDWKLL